MTCNATETHTRKAESDKTQKPGQRQQQRTAIVTAIAKELMWPLQLGKGDTSLPAASRGSVALLTLCVGFKGL